eukprot:scaffold266089_cov32-Tisochrysis_lutea.AAC.2
MLAIHELMVASSISLPSAQAVGTQSFLMETLERVAPSTSAHPHTIMPPSSRCGDCTSLDPAASHE